MTRDEFAQLIELYGADENRWPDNRRSDAQSFAKEHSADARQLLDDARNIDEALERARLEPGTDILKARIMNSLGQQDDRPAPVQQAARGFGYKAIAAMMAISFMMGFAGSNLLGGSAEQDETILLTAENEWETLASDYGMEDIVVWVNEGPAP